MINWISLACTLTAYTDTAAGLYLRSMMTQFVSYVDPALAHYIVIELHF